MALNEYRVRDSNCRDTVPATLKVLLLKRCFINSNYGWKYVDIIS